VIVATEYIGEKKMKIFDAVVVKTLSLLFVGLLCVW